MSSALNVSEIQDRLQQYEPVMQGLSNGMPGDALAQNNELIKGLETLDAAIVQSLQGPQMAPQRETPEVAQEMDAPMPERAPAG